MVHCWILLVPVREGAGSAAHGEAQMGDEEVYWVSSSGLGRKRI